MSASTPAPSAAPSAELSPQTQRGNIARLTIAQALAGANAVVVYATGAIVGDMLAPDKALATLPGSQTSSWSQKK